MNTTKGVVYKAKVIQKSDGMKLPPLLAVLWDQIDSAFPKTTSSAFWKKLNPAEREVERRNLFRILYGASPEFLALKAQTMARAKQQEGVSNAK